MRHPLRPPSEFSAADKLRCIERELRLRRVVFQHRVQRWSMTQEQADREIAVIPTASLTQLMNPASVSTTNSAEYRRDLPTRPNRARTI
jgi:hypothetical protein